MKQFRENDQEPTNLEIKKVNNLDKIIFFLKLGSVTFLDSLEAIAPQSKKFDGGKSENFVRQTD